MNVQIFANTPESKSVYDHIAKKSLQFNWCFSECEQKEKN